MRVSNSEQADWHIGGLGSTGPFGFVRAASGDVQTGMVRFGLSKILKKILKKKFFFFLNKLVGPI